jgi:hypothetical protein
MPANSVLLDAFGRVKDSMHRLLSDLNEDELLREPHPSIGWLGWRLTRVMDNNASRLAGKDQLWLAEGWHARFEMAAEPYDFGRSMTHTREQVRVFKGSADLILAYHDATQDRMTAYLNTLSQADLDRELDEPQYTPLPTVGVRLVSVLENAMQNTGQMSYLKAYHRLGGWFPAETKEPGSYR